MKLRVKATATRGHMVHGRMIIPGEELPGLYERIPQHMDYKLEEVLTAAPKPPEPDNGEDRPAWYKALAVRLNKDQPSKFDLRDFAEAEGVELPREPAAKAELIEAISKVKGA